MICGTKKNDASIGVNASTGVGIKIICIVEYQKDFL